jgi:hypothetical protein
MHKPHDEDTGCDTSPIIGRKLGTKGGLQLACTHQSAITLYRIQ